MPRFNAAWHWAKLEVPQSEAELKKLQSRISKRYPVAQVRDDCTCSKLYILSCKLCCLMHASAHVAFQHTHQHMQRLHSPDVQTRTSV